MNSLRVLIGLAVASGAALAFTMPAYTPYDGLITFDHMAMPLTPGALHINGAIGYGMASKGFDDDGDAQDLPDDATLLGIPLDIGYAIDERWLVDVTAQILNPKQGDADAFGLGDVWLKARALWETGPGFYLGPRLGVKFAVGEDMPDDPATLPLGDGQMDIDFAAVASADNPEKVFKGSAALGFRYRMKKTYSEVDPSTGQSYDVSYTPGTMIYLDLAPGLGFGPDQQWRAHIPIGYVLTMEDKTDYPDPVPDPEGTTTNALYVGVQPKYVIDENTTVGLKFLYTVMGKNVPQGMLIAATCDAFIPL